MTKIIAILLILLTTVLIIASAPAAAGLRLQFRSTAFRDRSGYRRQPLFLRAARVKTPFALIFGLSFRSENLLGFRRSVILCRGCILSCLPVFFGVQWNVRVGSCVRLPLPTRNFHEVPTFQIPRFEFGIVLSQFPPVSSFFLYTIWRCWPWFLRVRPDAG